jgi:hypothetical protein
MRSRGVPQLKTDVDWSPDVNVHQFSRKVQPNISQNIYTHLATFGDA